MSVIEEESTIPPFQSDEAALVKQADNLDSKPSTVKQVKVGVGGLFIVTVDCDGTDKECALLYKRYKEPEIYQWSLPGGHVEMYHTCEDTLKEKASHILRQTVTRDIEVHDVIVAVNHCDKDKEYHFVSPQYYIDILDLSKFKKVNTIEEAKANCNIAVLRSNRQLYESMNPKYNNFTSYEMPLLALVPIDLIRNMNKEKRKEIFIQTTIEAIEGHAKLQSQIFELNRYLERYKSWRTNM